MNKNDCIISTLPIKPQTETNIGMMLSPTIMDYIGTVLNIEKNIGFNILHSYDEKGTQLEGYLNYINESGIEYDSVFIDEKEANKLLQIVDKMLYDNYLSVKNVKKIRCECGRVDMIHSEKGNAKLYSIKNGKMICDCCGKECHEYFEKSLVFEMPKDDATAASIVPQFLKKELIGFSKSFSGSDILVSKNRYTGYSLDTPYGLFNIDIDFLWSNYFKLYEQRNQIYIASNHQSFIMYLMDNIARRTSDKKLTFIANPYLNMDLKEAKKQYELRKLKNYKKLLLLYNLKWKGKDCLWSDSVVNYLKNISDTKIDNLYKSMIISARELLDSQCQLELEQLIFKMLDKSTNMQNNILVMKKLYKEGRL